VRSVGVGQLHKHTSAVLRRLREEREPIAVTYRGRVVARLVPVEPRADAEVDVTAFLTDLDRLAAEIGAHWPAGVSAVDAVREQRREL
jgi:antitoxin (DNA-binding transcriptional repressor) of toxin-antitoxin stability system